MSLGYPIAIALCLAAGGALAQEEIRWAPLPGVNSASLAGAGAELVTSSAVALPDARHAIVTFWRPPGEEPRIYQRCIDIFDSDMHQTDGTCAATPANPP